MTERVLVVTPCRNEARYAQRTLDSMRAQTQQPTLWIIVDDGSTDDMPRLLAEFAAENPWVRIVRREDRGKRSVGPGVIDAFYAGLESVDPTDFDFVCKLDLDLDIPPRYFEILLARMRENPRIGTCSGKPYFVPEGRDETDPTNLEPEGCGDEMSVGMIKLYRRSCFDEIGGFVREVMWDGIDCHRCRMLGWIACSWDEPELRFVHLRPMGSSDTSLLRGRVRHGFGQYFMGTTPAFMVASAVFRMITGRPRLLGGAAMLWGYTKSALSGAARYADPEFRRFLRGFQRAALLRGKSVATARIDAAGESLWTSRHGGGPDDSQGPAGRDTSSVAQESPRARAAGCEP